MTDMDAGANGLGASPYEIKAGYAEIERLRAEVERLRTEIARMARDTCWHAQDTVWVGPDETIHERAAHVLGVPSAYAVNELAAREGEL